MDRRSGSTRRSRIISIPVHFIQSEQTQFASALKIQKALRGFLVYKSVKQIKTILREVVEIERRIETEKVIGRIDEKERLRFNETLMSLLLKLDSVRGICNGVRDCRKRVIKKAIALQETIDSISPATATISAPQIVTDEDRTSVEEVKDVSTATPGTLPDQDQVVVEEEKKTSALKENVDSTGYLKDVASEFVSDYNHEDQEEEPKTIHCLVEENRSLQESDGGNDDVMNPDEDMDVTKKYEGEEEMEMWRQRKRSSEYLLERMVEEKEKLVCMMKELNEKNEMQMQLLKY